MPPSLESILSSWREKLPGIKEKEPQAAEYGVCTQGALDGEGVWSTWVGVLEEGQLRLGLQAGSCPKGTSSWGQSKGQFTEHEPVKIHMAGGVGLEGQATRTWRDPVLGPPGSG